MSDFLAIIKTSIISFLFLLSLSCQNKPISKIDRRQIQNKTFLLIDKIKNDSLTIEFRDSTYHIYEYNDGHYPWAISNFENSSFLVLNNRANIVKKVDKETYECQLIGLSDWNFNLIEKDIKWKQEQISGTWIEEKYIGTDSADFAAPPIPDIKSNWPPSYKISDRKIIHNLYKKTESKIHINNTGEFITMELENPISPNQKEILWKIKSVTDSTMVINKIVLGGYSSIEREKEIKGLRLIKKLE